MNNNEEQDQTQVPYLDLDIDDNDLVQLINNYEKKFKDKQTELEIEEKREKNRKYYFGHQLKDKQTKSYEKKILDNIIFEGQQMTKALVLSRLPELVVKGMGKSERADKVAENLSKVLNKKLNSVQMKKVLGQAFDHLHTDYISVIKYRWDPHGGRKDEGAFVPEFIMPENLMFDPTVIEADENNMQVIIHKVTHKTVKEWIMLFPDKEEDIKAAARIQAPGSLTKEEDMLGYQPEVHEVWFEWFDKSEDFDADNNQKYDFESGVAWKIEDKILDKKLNPNWDWDGQTQFFYNGDPVPMETLAEMMVTDPTLLQNLEQKEVFKNYFKKPRKPFIFMTRHQWGDSPWEYTTSVEQNIPLQDNYDTRIGQITAMLDKAQPKHVFGGGITKETVQNLDLGDPEQDIVLGVQGDPRQIHAVIEGQLPPNQAFADMDRSRNRMLAKVNVNPATRGEIVSNTATTNQIAREGDFAQQDDLSEDTISPVAQKIAEAFLHMVKLNAEPIYFEQILGDDAEATQLRLTADDIDDGFIVDITASATDKLRAERAAKEEAQLGLIDPISYLKDTGRQDAEERAKKLFLWQTNPAGYIAKYTDGQTIQDLSNTLQNNNQQKMDQAQQVQQPTAIQQPQGGQIPSERTRPTPTNTQSIATNPAV